VLTVLVPQALARRSTARDAAVRRMGVDSLPFQRGAGSTLGFSEAGVAWLVGEQQTPPDAHW
jgi:hypothetical protein